MLTAIDHAVDMGLVDPSKITVLGGSHGGFLTTHLIGQVHCYLFIGLIDDQIWVDGNPIK